MIVKILVSDTGILWGLWGKGQIFRWVFLRALQGSVGVLRFHLRVSPWPWKKLCGGFLGEHHKELHVKM